MFQQFIVPAISFGLSAVSIPGPLQAYLINTTLTNGWRKGLLVVLSPLLTDAPIIILMTFLLGQLPESIINLIRIGGGILLLFIALGAWKQFRSGKALDFKHEDEALAVQSSRRVLLTGLMMNFLSPGPYLFWGTVNGPLLLQALEISPIHALAFLLAFYGTFLGGLSLVVMLFHRARNINEAGLRYIILFTIILLLWFGTALIAEALGLSAYHAPVMIVVLIGAGIILYRQSPSVLS